MTDVETSAKRAKDASKTVALASKDEKNAALLRMAGFIRKASDDICPANGKDVAKAHAKGMKTSLFDRLRLDDARVFAMADAIESVANLPDPLGETMEEWTRPNGLIIKKIRVPMGVIGIIYEARPNVTADAAALCLKAGSSALLRGGSDAFYSNTAIVTAMKAALSGTAISPDAVMLVEDTTRESANKMMKLNQYLDLLIPRGGAGLIKSVVNNATVPVIETGTGNCHIYVDDSADIEMAANIIIKIRLASYTEFLAHSFITKNN